MEVFQPSKEIDNQPTGEKDLVLRSMRKRNYYVYKEKILLFFSIEWLRQSLKGKQLIWFIMLLD